MFEYLMPLLVMPTYEGTLLDQTYQAAVQRQIEYGAQRGVPWGMSESGYNTTDVRLNYQYRAFGVPGLGFKRGLAEDLVIAPYASALALMVEVLCVGLTGAAFSFENDSYFEPGNKPRIGHAILAIDPDALAGSDSYFSRLEVMIESMLRDEGVRLPGVRRQKLAATARQQGVPVAAAQITELLALSGTKSI